MGTKTVQALQNQYEQSLSLDGQSEEATPQPVLPMEIRICIMKIMKRTDLYNKSRVMGDYQARFCENAMVKVHGVTRLAAILEKKKMTVFANRKKIRGWRHKIKKIENWFVTNSTPNIYIYID